VTATPPSPVRRTPSLEAGRRSAAIDSFVDGACGAGDAGWLLDMPRDGANDVVCFVDGGCLV
jgi:hypothetical protein